MLSPAVTTIAAIESMEVLKNILGIGETLENRLLSYDGLNMKFKTMNIVKNPKCSLCG